MFKVGLLAKPPTGSYLSMHFATSFVLPPPIHHHPAGHAETETEMTETGDYVVHGKARHAHDAT